MPLKEVKLSTLRSIAHVLDLMYEHHSIFKYRRRRECAVPKYIGFSQCCGYDTL
ncbi:hypothetical protein DSUL_20140 [Desulfovibrionales bacterium]